jgi:RHS repeat-associated protein
LTAKLPTNSASENVALDYDAIGNLTRKTDYSANFNGAYSYTPNTHRIASVQLASGQTASFAHDAAGNITSRQIGASVTNVDYDIDNLARRISRNSNTSDFYEAPGGRYLQRLTNAGTTRDTWMLEKTYEREVVNGAVTIERYYIAGHLMTVKPGIRSLAYMHSDRLGSPISITEKTLSTSGPSDLIFRNGFESATAVGKTRASVETTLGNTPPTLVEHKGFDPFGKVYDGQWGLSNLGALNLISGQPFNASRRNQRGFTSHELDEFQLIHMNGRLYDQDLGRFFGVDPFIQFPSNSQSLNPYAYLMNNPLSGTDPTGYATDCTGTRIKDCAGDVYPSSSTGFRSPEDSAKTTAGQSRNGAAVQSTPMDLKLVPDQLYSRIVLQNMGESGRRGIASATPMTEPQRLYLGMQRAAEKGIGILVPGIMSDAGDTIAAWQNLFTGETEHNMFTGKPMDGVDAWDARFGSAGMAVITALTGGGTRAAASLSNTAKSELAGGINIAARFGNSRSTSYRSVFFDANPNLEGRVVVHHAVEQQTLTRFPGTVTQAQIHSLENLRGIPKAINADVHLSQIRKSWNEFYRNTPSPTQQQLLDHATMIDDQFGHLFIPPVR